MKNLILILCSVLLFNACKKTETDLLSNNNNSAKTGNISQKKTSFNDAELNINTASDFVTDERNIKGTILSMGFISNNEKLELCKGVIMENNHIIGIEGSAAILERMSLDLKIEFMRMLFPNKNFKIFNNRLRKVEYEFIYKTASSRNSSTNSNLQDYHGMILEYPSKTGGYGSNCAECGNSSCMHYY